MGRPSKASQAIEQTTAKKARLTIAQLAAYDDVLTDVLVDHVFAWHHVRKNLEPWQVRNYKYSRGVNGEDVTRILFDYVVLEKNPAKALDKILQLSALSKYYRMLATDRERQDFKTHAAKYVNIWLPDCQFEVSFTNRYMVDQWEAKTTARNFVKTGDKIKYLCGNLVSITMDEEDDEKFIRNAFSITYSSRRKTPSLFLGPARFANHDCNANAKLESRGTEGMLVIAVRDIEIGDEINVHYGDNYFGEDNCECLCASCEKYGQGAWQYAAGEAAGPRTPRAGSREAEEPGSRRSKRKRNIVDYKQRLREANTKIDEERPKKRRRAETEFSTPTPSSAELKERKRQPFAKALSHVVAGFINPRKSHQARNVSMLSQIGRSTLPPKAPFIKSENRPPPNNNPFSPSKKPKRGRPSKRRSSSSAEQGLPKDAYYKSHMLFAFLKRETVVDEDMTFKRPYLPKTTLPSVEVDLEVSHSSSSSSGEASIFDHPDRQSASPETEPPSAEDASAEDGPPEHVNLSTADVYDEENIPTPEPPKRPELNVHSNKNTTPPARRGRPPKSPLSNTINPRESEPTNEPHRATQEIGEIHEPIQKEATLTAHTQPITVPKFTPVIASTETVDANDLHAPPTSPTNTNIDYRIPGDYIRTPKLLGPKNSRWVECRTCDEVFIQQDAHQTRRECPRCERHSKLYGFQWPQTDHERGGAERVMDHRTVNRFLSRAEEMSEPKRGRGCVGGSGAAAVGARLGSQRASTAAAA